MRMSDWSSDVCSADLANGKRRPFFLAQRDQLLDPIALTAHRDRTDLRRGIERIAHRHGAELRAQRIDHLVVPIAAHDNPGERRARSEEHTSELQSLMRISYAVFCLKKKKPKNNTLNKQEENNK